MEAGLRFVEVHRSNFFQQTVDIIPAASGNVWWFYLIPQKSLTYHLIRLGTDRVFGITFDISKLVPNPPLSWNWEE
jgi:hypothetical protein